MRIEVLACLLTMAAPTVSAQHTNISGYNTIREDVQRLAEKLLTGKQGSIVAIDPETGEVICMASHNRIDDGVNRAISKAYSPGSTFKTVQALTLLSEKNLNQWQEYKCSEGFWKDKIHIGCHKHNSPLDLVNAIGQSCNSYFCKAFANFIDDRVNYPTKNVAINRWARYMRSMGLGSKLGIDIEGEVAGAVPDSAMLEKDFNGRWNGTTIMWVGMGQGEVQTTPLQLCNMAAVIANRGWYITPHVHKGTAEQPLDSMYISRHYSKVAKEAFPIVIKGMRLAATEGTCKSINTNLYEVCGKTGTAENEGDDHSIFIGFAPMDKPKVAVSVYIENGGFGADLAAPLGGIIMEQTIEGKLTPRSENHVRQWSNLKVKVKAVEIPMGFDDF